MKTHAVQPFTDQLVIYFSQEDGRWIAHSLRTDQIGTGDRIVEAVADMIAAVDTVCRNAVEDGTLAYLREAPDEIKAMAAHAQNLPLEIYEVAHKIALGEWPREIDPAFDAAKNFTFHVDVQPEPVPA
jgi:hypothetical protein